jgi:hypothetical protein
MGQDLLAGALQPARALPCLDAFKLRFGNSSSGAAGKVIEQLVKLRPRNIVYVACDPVALARDLGSLSNAGYQLRGLKSLDIFPHTHHFEAVAALTLG